MGGGRLVEEGDLDFSRAYRDPLDDLFDNAPALLERKLRPAGVEGGGFRGEVSGGEVLDREEGDLPLEARDLGVELRRTLFERPVALPETLP